jgi:hypothetical protein
MMLFEGSEEFIESVETPDIPEAQYTATESNSDPVSVVAQVDTLPESVSESVTNVAASVDADPDLQLQHEQQIEAAEKDLAECAVRRADLEATLKLSKAEYKEALDYLVALKKRGPQSQVVASSSGAEAPTDNSWRVISTERVLEGIENLGTKKRELILSEFPTLGDLEDARNKSSLMHKPFKEVLPKGIGSAIADQLETRIGDVMIEFSKMLEKSASGEIAVANMATQKEETFGIPVDLTGADFLEEDDFLDDGFEDDVDSESASISNPESVEFEDMLDDSL